MEHYVIIGGGTAGNVAAETLRQGDAQARVTLISADPTHYVYRHRLADFAATEESFDSLIVHDPKWYEDRKVQLRLAQPVVQVRPSDKSILLAHRERITYDKLLICSGERHRLPEYLSPFDKFINKFSSGRDAIMLKARMDRIEHVTLLGGDSIGLQLISALLPAGKKVTLVMDEYRFWPFEFDDKQKDRMAEALSKKGVQVLKDDFVTDVQKQNGGLLVKTRGGARIATDEAILCSGMVPSLEFLADSGIDMQEGVLVNERLETSAGQVWAAGGCAQIYHPELNDYRCSTGYVNALVQGELAARNMMGALENAPLCEPGKFRISGEEFTTYGWKGFSLDEKN
ncbi:MAG TPA: NAD(P)/FAD-dependent oxidoreductase [bacterium]|nr:NAD(P)/FAD-dependent oxidoreductase [bacterium]